MRDQPGHDAVRHRDVDELPLAALAPVVERRRDAERRHQRAAAQVGDLDAGREGAPSRGPVTESAPAYPM